jgi:hypothetical protein
MCYIYTKEGAVYAKEDRSETTRGKQLPEDNIKAPSYQGKQ